MRRKGKDFSGTVTPLFATMLKQQQAVEGEGSGQPSEPQHTPTTASPSHESQIPIVASSSHTKKTHKHKKPKRKATKISRSSRPTIPVANETIHKKKGDRVERAATIASSLGAEQASGNIIRTQSTATLNEPIPQGIGSGSGLRRQETKLGDRPAQTRFERLSKQSNDPPLSRVNILGSGKDTVEIAHLKKRFKKLERKKKSRTPQLKRRLFKVRIESSADKSLGDQEDASKQGRNISEVDQDEGTSWFQEDAETQGRYAYDVGINIASTSITTASINVTTAELVTTVSAPITTAGVSVSTADPNEKSKEKESKEKGVSSETTTRLTRGVSIQETSKTTTRISIVPPQQQLDPKDKGKGKMVEQEKPLKKKDQIKFDEELAQRLQAQLHAKLEEEDKLARQREKDANIALIEEWDNVQAMMDADYELCQRLQAQEQVELTIEERSRLFMELMDERKRHFARLRAEEKIRKPLTKAQKRNQMCTYLKNMVVKESKDKAEGSEKKAEGSRKKIVGRKRGGEKHDEQSVKKQKLKDDAEKTELKLCLEIVPKDDEVISFESLDTKYPIVDWKTHIISKDKMYYHIIRADGSLYDSCGVHVLLMDTGVNIHMLIEKKYPLTQEMLSRMLSRKLEVDHESEMGRIVGIKRHLNVVEVNAASFGSYYCWLYYYCWRRQQEIVQDITTARVILVLPVLIVTTARKFLLLEYRNIMDGDDIEDLTIEQYLRLTQETYFGESTPNYDPTLEFAHYFRPNQPSVESDYDSKDMEEEVEYMTDDKVVMSEQEESNHEYAQSTRHLEDEDDDDEWLNVEIKKHMNAKDNIMPQRVYEYLCLDKLREKMNSHQSIKKIYMVSIRQEEETFNPLEIGIDLFSYESPACLQFEQKTRSCGTINPQDEIARPVSLSPDRRGLVKIWHVCKPIHVTYDDGSGEDCGMWPTCDPDSKFWFRYNEVFRVNEHGTLSYDVKEEYAKDIGNPYSRKFYEYNKVFNNDIEHLSNEYILRIGKKGYVLDDVWGKCKQCYKKINEAWHNEGYEEDEIWRSGDEKTDYDPPYVNIKTFEVKKYSFKGGCSFVCITNREDDTLPLGHVNGARFKAMIRKELKDIKYVHEMT
ncbi:hypothetical protein Tco_0976056 [Tanacetum coccineum]|uniref:Uncharacterized protein n=1 Tax=Tanacetum coccineum TaxID=301880 RepID=A0ABQ5EG59_9ASTR